MRMPETICSSNFATIIWLSLKVMVEMKAYSIEYTAKQMNYLAEFSAQGVTENP